MSGRGADSEGGPGETISYCRLNIGCYFRSMGLPGVWTRKYECAKCNAISKKIAICHLDEIVALANNS